MSDVLDLSIFEEIAADTADMTVRHPVTQEPTPWVITVAGPTHPQSVALGERMMRKAMREEKAKEEARINGRKWKGEDRDPNDVKRDNISALVDRIVTWRGASEEFSREGAIALLLKPTFAPVVGQLADFVSADGSFIKRSATT